MSEEAPKYVAGEGMMEAVRTVLAARGHDFVVGDHDVLRTALRMPHGLFSVVFQADDRNDRIRSVASYGACVPEDRRGAVAEAMSRINLNVWLGNFELDFADGEVRFRLGCELENSWLSEQMVFNMLDCSLISLDQYFERIMKVAFSDADPAVMSWSFDPPH